MVHGLFLGLLWLSSTAAAEPTASRTTSRCRSLGSPANPAPWRRAGPKLICIDLQAYQTTQAPERSDILNVGGFRREYELSSLPSRGEQFERGSFRATATFPPRRQSARGRRTR